MEYYSAIKKNETFAICSTMEGLGMMWSEISQRKINTEWYPLYVEPKTYNKLVNKTEKQPTHRYREQTSDYQWGEGRESQHRNRVGKGLLRDYMKSCVWNFWKLWGTIEFKESFI